MQILCLNLPEAMNLMLIRAFVPLGHAVTVSQTDAGTGLDCSLRIAADPAQADRIELNGAALDPAIVASDPGFVAAVALALGQAQVPSAARTQLALEQTQIDNDDLQMDYTRQTAGLGGVELKLSGKEVDLLFVLGQQLGHLVSREELSQLVWGDLSADSKTIDVHVSRLRKRLGENGTRLITRRGQGYLLTAPS